MNIDILNINDVPTPPAGYGYGFIDAEDYKLKIKKSNNTIIEYANELSDTELLDLTNYTAFEVMPNRSIISAGTVDDLTGLSYTANIPACTVHKFSLRSIEEPENCDVVIDWGDGTIDSIKNGNYVSHTVSTSYELMHDYADNMDPEKDTQRFIVKIFGTNYWAFRSNSYKDNNLISRIFDKDLPLASHISNIASTCFGATRLLKVHFYNYYHRILNLNSLFCKCSNLLYVTGFGTILNDTNGEAGGLFEQCGALLSTDFCFPARSKLFGVNFCKL